MNILLLAKKNPWPPKDGEAIAILQMAKGLAAAGNRVTVMYMNTTKHHFDAEAIPSMGNLPLRFESVWVDSEISPFSAFFNLFKKIPYHTERFFSKVFLDKTISLIQQEKFDIIQAEGLYLVQYFPFLKKYNESKYIYRSHNQESVIWSNVARHSKNILKKWYLNTQSQKLKHYETDVIKNADAIIPISLTDTVHYKMLSPQYKVFYSPTGINPENILKDNAGMETKDLYFIGGLDWLPNTEGLLWFLKKIFPAVKKTFPEIQLHIAGRNAPDWLTKIQDIGIVFHGEVSFAADFIHDKFISIVPLLSGSGMKLKIIEAMAAGKPVITTVKGAEGMPSGVDEHIFIAVSAEDFIRQLCNMLNNRPETLQKAKAGKEFVIQHLNNETITKQLTQFYLSL